MAAGQFDKAGRLAFDAVSRDSSDWHAHYALGQFFRFTHDYGQACISLTRAIDLSPRNPSLLLSLGIARQLDKDFPGAINALRLALEIDPNFVLAFNSLAMTQKSIGDYEKAVHNYDAGLKALARQIVQSLNNSENARRFPPKATRHNLWTEYAMYGAIYLVSDTSISGISWPTGDLANRDAETLEFRGWYWSDSKDSKGETARMYLPNYFNTFVARLLGDSSYANLIGNRGTVLHLVGQPEEALRHMDEAEDFTGLQARRG